MNLLSSPPPIPVVSPHAGGHVRGHATAALTLAMLVALTSCTSPVDEERESTSSPDLGTRVGEYLDQTDEHDKVRAVLVYEDGAPILELYRGEDAKDYLDVRSVTKSVVSTVIGIAIDEGLISGVDATLGDLLPARRDAMNDEVAAIPLDRILTHTAGFEGDGQWDFSSAPDTVGAILADRVTRGPGDGSFEYSSAGSHVLSAILDEATDGRVLDFAREHLFDPLGIDTEPAWIGTDQGTPEERAANFEEYLAADFAWPTDPQGIHAGWSFMKLRPDDLATLGLLYLAGGEWEGESLVSPAWVTDATTTHVETSFTPNGYGYQWWTHTGEGDEMFAAVGYGGDLIAVVPDRNLVAVVVSTYGGLDPLENAQKFNDGEAMTLVQYVILDPPD
jgi:CubicO group peptidase (beta-lactamase class C family)